VTIERMVNPTIITRMAPCRHQGERDAAWGRSSVISTLIDARVLPATFLKRETV
jgi:hypothetical protein